MSTTEHKAKERKRNPYLVRGKLQSDIATKTAQKSVAVERINKIDAELESLYTELAAIEKEIAG